MKTFEEQIAKLEEIVKKLESGDCSLDDSLKLFEEGIKLSKACHNMLENAEKTVNVLVNGEKQEFKDLED
ncbi:MAG: exodeoxyribonuclease VII small subunit [Clostridia bacterium]|nr:exodeoxyribonuclease VII small subunit [Clostridia bacterium]